eukprot:SAG22_NODE_517_length_9528_cov_3.821508_3_plen_216_part_00
MPKSKKKKPGKSRKRQQQQPPPAAAPAVAAPPAPEPCPDELLARRAWAIARTTRQLEQRQRSPHQLVDTLADHLAVYSGRQPPTGSPPPQPPQPPPLLAALDALPPAAQAAGLTITNRRWVRTLCTMLQPQPQPASAPAGGQRCRFIVLPDLMAGEGDTADAGVCRRPSTGLLARLGYMGQDCNSGPLPLRMSSKSFPVCVLDHTGQLSAAAVPT